MSDFKLIQTTISHLSLLAKCHIKAFPRALSSSLGKRFVTHMFSWYLSSNKVFLFHLEDSSGNIVGYCGGMAIDGSLESGSASGMAQHSFWQAIVAFLTHPWVIFHPEVLAKLPLIRKNVLVRLKLKKKSHFTKEQKVKMANDPILGLVVIGVHPMHQGKGCGSILLKEFERRAIEDYKIYILHLTVKANNVNAIRAYERNGWEILFLNSKSKIMKKYLK